MRVKSEPRNEPSLLKMGSQTCCASTAPGLNHKLSIGNADGPEQRNTHVRCGDQLRLVLYPSLQSHPSLRPPRGERRSSLAEFGPAGCGKAHAPMCYTTSQGSDGGCPCAPWWLVV